MADDARQSLPDLAPPSPPASPPRPQATGSEGGLAELAQTFDFFEFLRRLERDGLLFGHRGGPEREPARLGQHVRLGFATQDVADYRAGGGHKPDRITVANLGLLGPEGPMPLHVTRWVLDRLSQRWFAGAAAEQTSDTTFVDFVNILQHRMMALFYRAWADAHPGVQIERSVGGRIHAMLAAMAGIGLSGTKDPRSADLDAVRLRQAAALAIQADGPQRLTLFLAEAFQVPVRLKEFIASWLSIPVALQSRLGKAHAGLGRGATIGPRTFSRQSRVEIEIGPLDLATYKAFLPEGGKLAAMKRAVRDLMGETLDVDLRIVLARDEVPPARIGAAALTRTAWLAPSRERGDAGDMRLRTIVGWRAQMAGAGA
jgi:type VI secretion system protein ImpH